VNWLEVPACRVAVEDERAMELRVIAGAVTLRLAELLTP